MPCGSFHQAGTQWVASFPPCKVAPWRHCSLGLPGGSQQACWVQTWCDTPSLLAGRSWTGRRAWWRRESEPSLRCGPEGHGQRVRWRWGALGVPAHCLGVWWLRCSTAAAAVHDLERITGREGPTGLNAAGSQDGAKSRTVGVHGRGGDRAQRGGWGQGRAGQAGTGQSRAGGDRAERVGRRQSRVGRRGQGTACRASQRC